MRVAYLQLFLLVRDLDSRQHRLSANVEDDDRCHLERTLAEQKRSPGWNSGQGRKILPARRVSQPAYELNYRPVMSPTHKQLTKYTYSRTECSALFVLRLERRV